MRLAFPSTFFYGFALLSVIKEGHSDQWVDSEDTLCGWQGDCAVDGDGSFFDNRLLGIGNDPNGRTWIRVDQTVEDCKQACLNVPECGGFTYQPTDPAPAGIFQFGNYDESCYFWKNAACNVLAATLGESCHALDRSDGSAAATGDPHFSTWSGRKYDFHGICDLVLIKNPEFQQGLGMTIHVRTKQMKQFSYISSAVLQVGHASLEVMGDIHNNLFWINKEQGKEMEKEGIVGKISGHEIKYRNVHSKQHEFIVNVGGASISMKTWKNFVHVGISDATESVFGSSKGLFGTYGTGELISRDGSKIFENTDEFGQEWQVGPGDESLFHEIEGPQAPDKCSVPLATNVRRRLAESNVSEEDAKLSCAQVDPDVFEMCVFDVMATGDNDVAGAY